MTSFLSSIAMFIGNLSYLEMVPREYYCTYEGSSEKSLCYPSDFCTDSSTAVVSYEPNMELPDSYHNFVNRLGMTCATPNEVALIGSAYFTGWIITLLILPRISDVYGR